ncbi:uncharacterized protein LTR77_001675 [Saxophila tyrrhenica]|uniref:Microsomal glutathione S-transferase 3 n=1 Tax=Saxophila tyrrhenica TaxID=1690608 RepID=A0AAV9PPC2_9PEZI|nr:hypothetical protein LTR77_001675 [Saxophila tyrrhenica]
MSVPIAIPKEYGYVVATTASTFFLSMWHAMRVGPFRKAAGIRYPQAYAENSDMANATGEKKHAMYLFNTAQRAHGNYMEHHAATVIAMLVAGVQYPIASSVMGVGWVLSRVVYAVGYTRKDKTDGSGRLIGSGFWLFELGLYGLTAWSGVKLLL